jgi:hypothetical protein
MEHVLDDEQHWQVLLGEIRTGMQLMTACKAAGVSKRALKEYVSTRPVRLAELSEAQEEAAEAVEEVLYAAAKAGEPWAVKMWLPAMNADRWGKQAENRPGSGGLVLDPAELHELVAGDVTDAEVIEDCLCCTGVSLD